MSLERDIARKFLYSETAKPRLRPVVKVSTIGIALGILLILISFFIIDGFKQEIRSKIDGFIGSVKISNPDNTFNRYTVPLDLPEGLTDSLTAIARSRDPNAAVYTFADEMSLIKVDSTFRAVAFHGVDSLFNADFFAKYMVEGEIPRFMGESDEEVLMSTTLAKLFDLKVGDRCLSYFTDGESFKVRRLIVSGLFYTGFEEYDQALLVGDIRLVRSVAGFDDDQVGGIQIHLTDHNQVGQVFDHCFDYLADRNGRYEERFTMFTSEELYPGIFSWLGLLDANVYMILVLMIVVAGITMITGIIVLVLEKVRAIALLKTLGQSDKSLRRVFLHISAFVLGRGVLWGNALALLLAGIQMTWKPLKLDPSQYYTAYVPMEIRWETLLFTNLIIVISVLLLVLIPTRVIGKIHPAQVLRFE